MRQQGKVNKEFFFFEKKLSMNLNKRNEMVSYGKKLQNIWYHLFMSLNKLKDF